MTPEELRTSFFAFVGRSTARRFVLQLRAEKDAETRTPFRQRRSDLRFWQEQLWNQYSQQLDGVPQDLDNIRDALLWCDVHDAPLENGRAVGDACGVTDRDGNLLDEDFGRIRDEQFPFGFGYWTLVCPACVKVCQHWMDNANANRRQ
jgi:hypothetical protein